MRRNRANQKNHIEWQDVTLSDLGTVARGKSKHRPRNDPSLLGGEYPFIQTSDIKHSNFYVNSYSQTYNEKGLAQSKLWPKGTMCMTIAANIAETAILGFPACFPDSVVGFIPDPHKADVKFVKYALDYSKHNFQKTAKGTAQDNLSLEKIDTLKIKAPPLAAQEKIASVLSAYDDLIENNEKRIKILEEMAQRLYSEWFVKFKFPGHEKVKMVESGTQYGMIPEGWEVSPLRTLTKYISRGLAPTYDDQGKTKVINQKCIRNFRLNFDKVRSQNRAISAEKQLYFGDILINSTGVGTLGRVTQVYEELQSYTADTHVTIVRPSINVFIDFLGLAAFYHQEDFERLGAGATGQTELSRDSIGNLAIVIASQKLMMDFSQIVRAGRKEAIILQNKNKILSRIRDFLIPQLVTGKRELT